MAGASAQQLDPLAPLPAPRPTIVQARPAPAQPTTASPAPALTGFDAYKLQLAARARREGVREATMVAVG